jgi:hypothetical protein
MYCSLMCQNELFLLPDANEVRRQWRSKLLPCWQLALGRYDAYLTSLYIHRNVVSDLNLDLGWSELGRVLFGTWGNA